MQCADVTCCMSLLCARQFPVGYEPDDYLLSWHVNAPETVMLSAQCDMDMVKGVESRTNG